MMKTHPFPPIIPEGSTSLIVGTLPPETAHFYFSNSPNTRLWDLLKSIKEGAEVLGKGGYLMPVEAKIEILKSLKLGISDIILKYARREDRPNSVSDSDIIPYAYNDLPGIAQKHHIRRLIFVYQSALKWFVHSLTSNPPVMLQKIQERYSPGLQYIDAGIPNLEIVLLPNPLSRGTKGMTLERKLGEYRKCILDTNGIDL